MRNKFASFSVRELAFTAVPAILLILAGFWLAAQFVSPAVPKRIVIAAASKGSPYYEAAQRYRTFLSQNDVTLEVRETTGSLENLLLIKEANSPVAAAFLQGGLASAKEAPDRRSIGRLFYEPIWVFYQGTAKLERLTGLVGKRVLIGPSG